jgi:hypothetical protein
MKMMIMIMQLTRFKNYHMVEHYFSLQKCRVEEIVDDCDLKIRMYI